MLMMSGNVISSKDICLAKGKNFHIIAYNYDVISVCTCTCIYNVISVHTCTCTCTRIYDVISVCTCTCTCIYDV